MVYCVWVHNWGDGVLCECTIGVMVYCVSAHLGWWCIVWVHKWGDGVLCVSAQLGWWCIVWVHNWGDGVLCVSARLRDGFLSSNFPPWCDQQCKWMKFFTWVLMPLTWPQLTAAMTSQSHPLVRTPAPPLCKCDWSRINWGRARCVCWAGVFCLLPLQTPELD